MSNWHGWSQQEVNFLLEKYATLTRTQLAVALGRSELSVSNKVHRLGIHKGLRRYQLNQAFFSSPSVLNSYWAGFIAADGYVISNANCAKLAIGLQKRDESHLRTFADNIGYNGPIKYCVFGKKGKGFVRDKYESAKVEICGCHRLLEDLSKFGIVPRKSLVLKPHTNLNIEQEMSYLCGLIDGDGTIRINENGRMEFSICGTREMMEWTAGHFDRLVHTSTKHKAEPRHRVDRTQKNHWVYKVTGFRAEAVLGILSQLDIPRLERKWSKVGKGVKPIYKCPYSLSGSADEVDQGT